MVFLGYYFDNLIGYIIRCIALPKPFLCVNVLFILKIFYIQGVCASILLFNIAITKGKSRIFFEKKYGHPSHLEHHYHKLVSSSRPPIPPPPKR